MAKRVGRESEEADGLEEGGQGSHAARAGNGGKVVLYDKQQRWKPCTYDVCELFEFSYPLPSFPHLGLIYGAKSTQPPLL